MIVLHQRELDALKETKKHSYKRCLRKRIEEREQHDKDTT